MNKCYMHNLESIPEDETGIFEIQMEHSITARLPDLLRVNKKI